MRLRNVMVLAAVLLTSRLAFLTESALSYKLIARMPGSEEGKKAEVMMMSMPIAVLDVRVEEGGRWRAGVLRPRVSRVVICFVLLGVVFVCPVQIVISIVLSKWSSGPNPMTLYLYGFGARLSGMLIYASLFSFLPAGSTALMPAFVATSVLFRLPCQLMFTSQMAFFAKVADPALGGTYMTLLNTLANLGYAWTAQVGLRSISFVKARWVPDTDAGPDAFVAVTLISVAIGVAWLWYFVPRVLQLQRSKINAWRTTPAAV